MLRHLLVFACLQMASAATLFIDDGNLTAPGPGSNRAFVDVASCGQPSITPMVTAQAAGVPRVTEPHSFPWLVSLILPESVFCSGVIISADWIIASSACVYPHYGQPSLWTMDAGAHFRNGIEKGLQRRRFAEIIFQPNSSIVLMNMNEPLEFTNHVSPICLAGRATPQLTDCFTVGWWSISARPRRGNELYQHRETLLSRSKCKEAYEHQMCVQYGMADLKNSLPRSSTRRANCRKNLSGPMVCRAGSTWYLKGVPAVFDDTCDQLSVDPVAIFNDVAAFDSWILEKTDISL